MTKWASDTDWKVAYRLRDTAWDIVEGARLNPPSANRTSMRDLRC